MDTDNLVRMANRIGEFFAAMPDHQEAVDGIVTHLRKFWEPRMRRELLQHVDEAGTAGLHPLVAEAVQAGRETLRPA